MTTKGTTTTMAIRWLTTRARSRRQLGYYLGLVLIVILGTGLLIRPCESAISDLRRCYDQDCSEVVSLGKTTIPYHSKDSDVLSFPANVDVKIYSKQAGKRNDLWGIEVLNKRGYAPLKFIRELKVLRKDLNYTVPTEDGFKKVENSTDNIQEPIATSTVQDQEQVPSVDQIPSIDAFNKSKETITPIEISPSYETIYDGTIIPQDIEEAVTPPQPSYSTQTVQDNSKPAEEVKLDVYPNILSSTFNAISGILSGSDDSSENDSVEVASLESGVIDQTTEKTPSLTPEEKQSPPLETALPESSVESVAKVEVSEPKVSEDVTSETVPQVDTPVDESVISKEEEDATTESSMPSESQEAIVDEVEAIQNDTEAVESVIEPVVSKSSTEVPSSAEIVSPIDSPEATVVEEEAKTEENVIVPKVDESVALDSISNETDTAESPNLIPDEPKDVLNITSDFVETEDTIASPPPPTEVPLTQEIKEEPIPASSESFLPIIEPPLEPSISKIDSIPTESIENIDVSQIATETSAPIEEPKPAIDEIPNLDEQVSDVDSNNVSDTSYPSSYVSTYIQQNDSVVESMDVDSHPVDSSLEGIVDIPATSSFNEFLQDRNLLNAAEGSEEIGVDKIVTGESPQYTVPHEIEEKSSAEIERDETTTVSSEDIVTPISEVDKVVVSMGTCEKGVECLIEEVKHQYTPEQNAVTSDRIVVVSSATLWYVCITAVTVLLFSLGCYFMENRKRDSYLISKINKLEKDLMVTRKECIMLDENFKSTKTKLDSIEDESFGSNEMVLSLKTELEASEKEKEDLREQIASLERDLEGASEAGLELERMLREILASQSEDNPLAQSIQDLQDRLNDQQDANEALTKALALKTQENETLTGDLTISLKKVEQLQTEVNKLAEELTAESDSRLSLEQSLSDQVQQLEIQVKSLTDDKSHLRKQLKMKELEVKELMGVVEQINSNNLDFEKLYEVSHIKAEAAHLQEERDELKIKLSEEEGAHQLLEEHVKLVKEEVGFLSEQCKAAEKEKKDAETRLEVLKKFFEEKQAQWQKEEAMRLDQQGEVMSTVERIQTMQSELLNYKQQIEMLKREILDQEREYKSQISALETKAHEHWVAARQNERRLEEVKAESSQLRNRLTLVEKNINETDPEVKLHRLQQQQQHQAAANGEAHPMFPGGPGENSSSPLMFAGGPLPPPSYLYSGMPPGAFPPPPPPFLPPPLPPGASGAEAVGSRPAPLGGGRLSSPPPPTGRAGSPPPLSPPPLLHHGFSHHPPHHLSHHHHHTLHSPPPLPPYASDVPLPPPPHMMVPPPPMHRYSQQSQQQQQQPQQQQDSGNSGNWSLNSDSLPGQRNSAAFHAQQRSRNHKGSLHSSGESLDKSYGGKV